MDSSFLTKKEHADLIAAVEQVAMQKPPTIVVTGVSGAGKTSVINRLFKTTMPVSHTVACTKEFISTDLALEITNGAAAGTEIKLRVKDCPGLGEDITKESEYLEYYRHHLPDADVILHISASRNRAVALEQQHLTALKHFGHRMVFGLSQIDMVEPLNWNDRLNFPSKEQATHVAEICEDRAARFSSVLDRKVSLIPFSSRHGFGLQKLFTAMILACPEERSWLFDGLKAFKFSDFVPKAALSQLGNDILKPNS